MVLLPGVGLGSGRQRSAADCLALPRVPLLGWLQDRGCGLVRRLLGDFVFMILPTSCSSIQLFQSSVRTENHYMARHLSASIFGVGDNMALSLRSSNVSYL